MTPPLTDGPGDVVAHPADRSLGDRVLIGVALVVAAVPIIRMARLVQGATTVQYNDYWFMIASAFRRDGWLDIGGLFTLHNEHPVAVPKLIFWANARLTGGSNNSLGWIVLLIVLAQLALLISFFGRRVPLTWRAVAAVSFSALLFTPQGSWNFVKAMSGTAWLTANLCAIAAIALRTRNHRLAAVALGVLASLSYATGLLVWPAVLVCGYLRDRKLRSEWPTALGAMVMVTWFVDRYRQIDHVETLDNTSQLPLRNAGTLLGSVFTGGDDDLTRIVGWTTVAIAVALTLFAIRKDARCAAPWTGLLTYTLGSAALIALGRNLLLGDFASSRYASIGALLAVAAVGQFTMLARRSVVHAAVCVAVAVAASLPGADVVENLRNGEGEQELLAIALRLDLADDSLHWYAVFGERFPEITPVLRATGHHPFGGRSDRDCGLLGHRLDADGNSTRPVERGRVRPARPLRGVPGAVEIVGTLDGPARCVVVIDESRRVVGMGLIGYQTRLGPDSPPNSFTAFAPAGRGPYEIRAVGNG